MSNKLKMFGKLYLKDLHEVTAEILVVVIGVALVTAGFLLGADEKSPLLIAPLILLLGLAGLLPLISSFKLLSREWSHNTVYLIMSLPVSGTMVMGAKMLVLLTQYLVGTLLVALSAGLLYASSLYQFFTPQQPGYLILQKNPELFQYILAFYLSSMVLLVFLCCISFFSQVVGKLSAKFSGLITAATFIATLIITGEILDALGIGNTAGNPVVLRMIGNVDDFFNTIGVSSLSYLLLAIVIFILAAIIYDRKLEL